MSIKKKADKAVSELDKLLPGSLSDEQQQAAQKIIEKAMIDSVRQFSTKSSEVINQCCSADQDMAHKLNDKLNLARKAIIANLSGMR